MPLDAFPLSGLERARSAEDWPVDLYDISDAGYGQRDLHVELITPPLVAHLRGVETDLTYWANELGGLPPVVIARIYPRVGQSTGGVLANLVVGVVAGVTGAIPRGWIYDPELKGDITEIRVQVDQATVSAIELKRSWSLAGSTRVPVIHLVLPHDVFRVEGGRAANVIIHIQDAEGQAHPWGVPEATVRQIVEDFREYRNDPGER